MGQLEIQPESSLYVLPMVRMWTASNGVRLLNRPLIRTFRTDLGGPHNALISH